PALRLRHVAPHPPGSLRRRVIPKCYLRIFRPEVELTRMKNLSTETTAEIIRSRKPVAVARLVELRASHARLRPVLPPLRPRPCPALRAALAALHEAEQAAWQASGGDVLHINHND